MGFWDFMIVLKILTRGRHPGQGNPRPDSGFSVPGQGQSFPGPGLKIKNGIFIHRDKRSRVSRLFRTVFEIPSKQFA